MLDGKGSEPAWAAVVVNYNAGDALTGCVSSILEDQSAPPVEVVVVDNDSRDGSSAGLERAHPGVALIRAGANLGYARAANLGIAATRAPVVAVLNPDTLLRPGTAAAMLARLSADPAVGAAGPQLLNPDGSVYPSARTLPGTLEAVGHGLLHFVWPDNRFSRSYRQSAADPTLPREVDWVSGAAVWLRRAALDEVGGWDERYFMYVEDVDLCWRLGGAGWRVVYEPSGVVEHVVGVSTGSTPYRMIAEHHRSLLRFASLRFIGPRRLLLPPAAAFLGLRALLAMADHRARSRRARPASR